MKKSVVSYLPSALAVAALLTVGSASALNVKADNFQQAESPWDMAFLKDGTMFFTEKCKGLSVRTPNGDVKKLLGVVDQADSLRLRTICSVMDKQAFRVLRLIPTSIQTVMFTSTPAHVVRTAPTAVTTTS